MPLFYARLATEKNLLPQEKKDLIKGALELFFNKKVEEFNRILNSKLEENKRMFQTMIFDALLDLFKIPDEYIFEYFLSTRRLLLYSEFCKNQYLKGDSFYTYKQIQDENYTTFSEAISFLSKEIKKENKDNSFEFLVFALDSMDEVNLPEKIEKLPRIEQQNSVVRMMKGLNACIRLKGKEVFF